MNDLEHELRELLRNKADEAWSRPEAPLQVLRRARRRQVTTAALAGVAAVVLAAGSFAGIRLAGRGTTTPGTQGQTVTDTLNGITITHPEGWFLADPVATGIEPEPGPGEERLVLLLSKHDPSIPGLIGCPGQVQDRAPGEALMTVQEQVPVVGEHDFASWPAALEEVFEGDPTAAGCYAGWTFYRARFTSEGRFFQATAGVASDATDDDRQAIFDAFASMQFTAASAVEGSTAAIAQGTAAGTDWQLVATRRSDGLELQLQWEAGAAAIGGVEPGSEGLQFSSHTFGAGSRSQTVVFGVVRSDVVKVKWQRSSELNAPFREADPIDLPDALDPEFNAFVLTVPVAGGHVIALDAAGFVVGNEVLPPASGPGRIDPGEVILEAAGETAGQRWTLHLIRRGELVAFELQWNDGATGAAWDSVPDRRDLEFTFEEFGAVDVEVVAFGIISDRVARVVLAQPDGPEIGADILIASGPGGRVRAFLLTAPRPPTGSVIIAFDEAGGVLEARPFYGDQ